MSFNQGHALLIGVGTHEHHTHLDKPITVADAIAVQKILQNENYCGYPPTQVKLLKETTATKVSILAALDKLSQVQPEDTVFLFFAGHGSLGTDGNYYLMTHDVQVDGARVIQGTGVSEEALLTKLKAIPANRIFMVFNACHSGHMGPETLAPESADDLPETLNPSGRTAHALLGTGEGRVLIVACREREKSYIGPGELTIFTQALTEGLKGDARNNGGMISAFGLYEYLYHEVKEAVQSKYDKKQEPMLTVINGVGPFPVALYRGASSLGAFADDRDVLRDTAVNEISPQKAKRSFNNIVGGDMIKVGNISNSSGIAIGRGAKAVGNRGVNVDGDVSGNIITGDNNEIKQD